MDTKTISTEKTDMKKLKKTTITRAMMAYLVMGLIFFLTAGTIRYWEAWAYMGTILIPMSLFGVYLFRHDPKLLERRLRTREKRKEQKLIIKLGILPFIAIYILPGLDRRWEWSEIDLPLKVAGLVLVLLGYLMLLYVLKVNSYASRVVDVEEEQQVISTGPYGLVRHPMYTAVIIFYGATPLILGSLWAFIPALLILPVLVFRILDEEKELSQNLVGYQKYAEQIRWRLIPGIW